jgi:hypothetical protein
MPPSPPPPPVSSRVAPRRGAGFALLAILLLIAALTMMIGMSLQTAQDSRRVAAQAHHEQRAAAIAEAGMERTRAYIYSVLESNVDLDRALDPELDTNCGAPGFPDAPATAMDDHVPLFTDTNQVLEYPTGSGMYYKFARHGGGGYLVRIDDNEDDGLDNPALNILAATTNNNIRSPNDCREGVTAGIVTHNPVRDRDRSVIVTAMGFYPLALDPAPAALPANAQLQVLLERVQARRLLRARVGPALNAGLIMGGNVDFKGNSRVCGAFGNVLSTGNLSSSGGGNPELCGSNCSVASGGASDCTAMSTGNCNLSFSSSSSSCQAGASVPQPPPVHVWSSVNAPPPCVTNVDNSTSPPTVTTTCIPFYYLRQGLTGGVHLFMWNYSQAQCENPQSQLRIPTPESQTQACWVQVYDGDMARARGCTTNEKELRFDDSVRLQRPNPAQLANTAQMALEGTTVLFPDPGGAGCPPAPTATDPFFKMSGSGFNTGATTCERSHVPYPPNASNPDLQPNKVPKTDFKYDKDGVVIPRGVWLVEGNVDLTADTPACTANPALPWGVSMLIVGNLKITGAVFLRPMHPRGYVLLTGRDLTVESGNTEFGSCDMGGAIMVHEQVKVKSNSIITAQLVVESAASCSNEETSNEFSGTAEIRVTQLPPISAGNAASLISWSDSAL